MNRSGIVIFIGIVFLALDIYSFYAMKSIMGNGKFYKFFVFTYLGLSLFTYYSLSQLYIGFSKGQMPHSEMFNFMSGFVFTMLITKLLFSSIMIVQDGGRLFVGTFTYLKGFFSSSDPIETAFLPERRQFITTAGTLIAGIPFFSMLYGITKGKYQYTVEKIVLTFKDLPKNFDGFKIVQISDIHSGSFDNKDKVFEGIKKINELNADIVCFTGDLVNAEKDEIDPYIDIFEQIQSKLGKYAVLGNHDYYGNYDRNNSENEKAYFDDFQTKFDKMGFKLLKNSNEKIALGNESINLVGVENWGAGRWFPKKGDLDLATESIKDKGFNILLSHDPTHWDQKVIAHQKHMHLTLCGHTHGFQFGFKMPGFKWSPAQYRYERWMGLYQEAEKYLYVNRGFGFLGFPGRVGMWPEITLIELRRSNEIG